MKFWGSPDNSVGGDWAFARERLVKIRKHWNLVPDDTDMLITHELPYGTLDKPHILAKHARCQYLLGAVLRIKPRLHVFGLSTEAMAWSRHGAERSWSTAP